MMRKFSRFIYIVWPIMCPAVCLAGILIDHHGLAIVGLIGTAIAMLAAVGVAMIEKSSHQRCHVQIDEHMKEIARLHAFRMSEAIASELEELEDSMERFPPNAFLSIPSLRSALNKRTKEIRAAAPEPPLWPLDMEISLASKSPSETSDKP